MTLVLSTEYKNTPLALIKEFEPDLQKVWKSYPVRLSGVKAIATGFEGIVGILKLECSQISRYCPSSLAALKADEVASDLLKCIDAEFTASMEGYKKRLRDATVQDSKTILSIRKYCIRFFWLPPRYSPQIGKKRIITFEAARNDSQAFRETWITEVNTLEAIRLAGVKVRIEERVKRCRELMAALPEHTMTSKRFAVEIDQLSRVYKAVFSSELR